ncbi:ABC transporter permease subunit [Bradyrhizobium canariense]|nr:ABC transporter permease subunit [Bradyrhizobium canariense]
MISNETRSRIGYPLAGAVIIVATWAMLCVLFKIPEAVLPSPDAVIVAFADSFGLLLREGWVTLTETLLGFALAMAVGLPLAVAIANSRPLNLMFYPLLVALQSVPKVALAAIVLVWLGTGLESKLAIVWLVAFFPIIIDTAAGLRSTPPQLIDLARSLKASPWQTFYKV